VVMLEQPTTAGEPQPNWPFRFAAGSHGLSKPSVNQKRGRETLRYCFRGLI
jgi:hypothetical protein